jgi:hypothetical protein
MDALPLSDAQLIDRAVDQGVGMRSEAELFAELRGCGFDLATLARLWPRIWARVSGLNAESARAFA